MKNLDLSKILCQCPIGTPLYSTAFGTVIYQGLAGSVIITTMTDKDETSPSAKQFFRYDGTLATSQRDAECILFPSYNNRDWSLFKAPKSKVNVTLHPFDKVLVRDADNDDWKPDILSYIEDNPNKDYPFVAINECWVYCIPYNENTARLLGTSDAPDEEYEILFSKDFNVI